MTPAQERLHSHLQRQVQLPDGQRPRVPLIIDEFSYLVKASPALPSLLRREIDGRGPSQGGGSRARVLLCGSAMSVMGGLLAGNAPLRDVLANDPQFTADVPADALDAAFDLSPSIEAAAVWVDRALAEIDRVRTRIAVTAETS